MTKRQACSEPEPYDFSKQIGHLLRRAYHRHLAIFQQNASDPQLTSVQFATLCALLDDGSCSQAELVQITAIDQATIRGILDRLKARNLITISPASNDRRKVIASLAPTGRATLDSMIPCARRITELTLAGFNPAERVAIHYVLDKIINRTDS
jgi:DNA-binding MarR family transcriptional regulator